MLHRSSRYKEEISNLIKIILQVRQDHPRMCCRDLYYRINPLYIGRDRFEALCKQYGFEVGIRRSFTRTTDSRGVIRFPNLIDQLKVQRINQVWSSDITYFDLQGVFYYITFIIDHYSRRILGYSVSSRLQTEHTTLPALIMAIVTRGLIPQGIIFHSDGGGQYYDRQFLILTSRYKFKNSMCEMAYQNGMSERLNGIIKNNYLRHWNITNLAELIQQVDRAVRLYNMEKPHSGLGRMTPCEFEKKYANLSQQNRSKANESIDEKADLQGIEPCNSEQNRSKSS